MFDGVDADTSLFSILLLFFLLLLLLLTPLLYQLFLLLTLLRVFSTPYSHQVPGRTAVDMGTPAIAELAKHPNIIGLKDVSTAACLRGGPPIWCGFRTRASELQSPTDW